MTHIMRKAIDEVLTRLWENVQELERFGAEHVDPHDVYADAAMTIEMAKEANIPLEELVSSEKDRNKLAEYAAHAVPYDSG